MSESRPMVIVGAGLAGDSAAAEMRAVGWQGRIIMIGDEAERPYDRPPLSKSVLLSSDPEESVYFRPASWYVDNGIEMILGDACVGIDCEQREIHLNSGKIVEYGKLLLATGARVRRLEALESGMFPVHYLRTLADARMLRNDLREGARIAIVGGGVIGLEIAASAILRGCSVTVIEGLDRVMGRCVSQSISSYLTSVHAGRGVDVRCNARLSANQDVKGQLLFQDGSMLAVDAVVVGIGALPNSELAERCGIAVDNGIVVDRFTRTSDRDIHAAGDVAFFECHAGYARAEHWRHAIDQACIAARVMAGAVEPYKEEPWLWTDQFNLNIQITGSVSGDAEVLRGSFDAHAFTLFHLRDGSLVGATSVNRAKHKRAIASLVRLGAQADPARLADESIDLKTLAKEAEATQATKADADQTKKEVQCS